jgi:cyclopropane fatty-acyl-phospholipid synthase-like methyltransferase
VTRLFIIRTTVRRFLPRKLKGLANRILLGDSSRFSVENPRRFDWDDIDEAKRSILWYVDWEETTRSTIELMRKTGVIKTEGFVVDWGCGVGRIASKLTERFNVTVLAVDRSTKMLGHALTYIKPQYLGKISLVTDEYVLSHIDLFEKCADSVIFIEAFQHIPEPALDQILPRIEKLLKKDGKLFVFGNKRLDTGYEHKKPSTVEEVLERHFELEKSQITFQNYSGKLTNYFKDPRPRYSFVARSTS